MTTQAPGLSNEIDLDFVSRAQDSLQDGAYLEAFTSMLHHLGQLRDTLSADEWKAACTAYRAHPLHQILCQCPFHGRAFHKPRGYAGDAPTLDYIYGLTPLEPSVSEAGRIFFEWQSNTQSMQSVRARKDRLAELIDETASRVNQPRILSVACGHLREALRSEALRSGRVGQLFALDQDAESIELVRNAYSGMPVEPVLGSVRGLLGKKVTFSELDLIYSAGLHDYLADPVANRLNEILFDMLLPGGRLVVANFAPNLPDIGFVEASMDWQLIYRDEAACGAMTASIDPKHPRRFFRDEPGNIVFVEVTRLP